MGLQSSWPGKYGPQVDTTTGNQKVEENRAYDSISNAVVSIDGTHERIHSGYGMVAIHQTAHGTATAATMLITTVTAQNPHVVLAVSADKGGKWTFSEAPNASGGSAITSYNRDRSSSLTAGTTITHTATYVSAGTILDRGVVGAAGGNPNSVTGGGSIERPEWILAASTIYLVRFVADNATTVTNIRAEYYYES